MTPHILDAQRRPVPASWNEWVRYTTSKKLTVLRTESHGVPIVETSFFGIGPDRLYVVMTALETRFFPTVEAALAYHHQQGVVDANVCRDSQGDSTYDEDSAGASPPWKAP